MTDKKLARPRQATVSGWVIIVGSIMVVLFAFQQVTYLGSIEAQDMAQEFVTTSPGDGLGISADDVQSLLRVLNLIVGACATAMAILGWQVLQASRSARVALSVLAPVLLVSGIATAGLASALVTFSVALLWVQPTRNWFAGLEPPRPPELRLGRPRTTPPAAPQSQHLLPPPPSSSAGAVRADDPTSTSAWGLPAPGSPATMSAMSSLPAPPAPPVSPYGDAFERPARVTRACIVTIVVSSITFAGLLVSLLYVILARDALLDQVRDELAKSSAYDEISADAVANVALGFLGVLLVWAAVAVLLAVLTMRGSNGARITLAISAILAAIVSLMGLLAIVPLAITVSCILVTVWLFGSEAKAWTARR